MQTSKYLAQKLYYNPTVVPRNSLSANNHKMQIYDRMVEKIAPASQRRAGGFCPKYDDRMVINSNQCRVSCIRWSATGFGRSLCSGAIRTGGKSQLLRGRRHRGVHIDHVRRAKRQISSATTEKRGNLYETASHCMYVTYSGGGMSRIVRNAENFSENLVIMPRIITTVWVCKIAV